MTRWTHVVLPAGRAALVAAAAAGLVALASGSGRTLTIHPPNPAATLAPAAARPVTSAVLACPGPERVGLPGMRSVEQEVTVAAAAPPASAIEAVATGWTNRPAVGGIEVGTDTTERADSVVQSRTAAPAPVLVHGSGALAPGLTATQTWQHSGDDDRGLAVSACLRPKVQTWLVGGAAGAARTERVILANPGQTTVQASVTVIGSTGPVADATGRPVTIEPGGREVLSLDALAPGEPAPAVHITAGGSGVSAWLSDSLIEGATSRGSDTVGPSADPAHDLTIVAPLRLGGTVRLVNPGERESLARIRLVTGSGTSAVESLRAVRVPARSTVDAAVPASEAAYGLRVTADAPLTASVFTQRLEQTGADLEGDLAWSAADPPITGLGTATVPVIPGLSQHLVLVAGDAPATATLLVGSADGSSNGTNAQGSTASGSSSRSMTVSVPAGSGIARSITGTDRVVLVPRSGELRGTVVIAGTLDDAPVYALRPLTEPAFSVSTVPVREVQR